MLRRRRIKKKSVNFYKPNVVFAPPKMNFIFKSILDNGPLFKMHLQVIKETMPISRTLSLSTFAAAARSFLRHLPKFCFELCITPACTFLIGAINLRFLIFALHEAILEMHRKQLKRCWSLSLH
jgi:hypothetical protein